MIITKFAHPGMRVSNLCASVELRIPHAVLHPAILSLRALRVNWKLYGTHPQLGEVRHIRNWKPMGYPPFCVVIPTFFTQKRLLHFPQLR